MNQNQNQNRPKCAVEEHGLEWVEEREREAILKHGWYAHWVFDDPKCPFEVNFHTHGVESYGHRNLQLCMKMNPQVVMSFFHIIIDRIKKGEEFLPDVDYPDIAAGGYMVRFIETKECGRDMLRIIIPAKDGTYDKEPYSLQLTMLDNE